MKSSRSLKASPRMALMCLIAMGFSLASAAGGCASYRFGAANLYPSDIHTVYVPIFESNSFRRNLGEQLTEAVMKEIERQTPYKVVGNPNADSVLSGKIMGETKKQFVKSPTDEGREVQVNFQVQVAWVDRKGDLIRQELDIPMPPELAGLSQSTTYIPEVGQSLATAQQKAIKKLARQIVAMMEAPW